MRFDDFKRESIKLFQNYFDKVHRLQKFIQKYNTILFPKFIIFTEFNSHYAVELLGGTQPPVRLVPLVRKSNFVEAMFDPFVSSTGATSYAFSMRDAQNLGFIGIAFHRGISQIDASERLPFYSKFYTRFGGADNDGIIDIGRNGHKITFEDCICVSAEKGAIRCRYFQFAAVCGKSGLSISSLQEFYNSILRIEEGKEIVGVRYAASDEKIWKSAQLQTLFMSNGVHETSIGAFLSAHSEIITKGLSCLNFYYEPTFPWLEHDGSVEDKFINPDLLVQRLDGHFDIVDLKLAGLEKKKLTKGQRKRRRFIDYVSEGLAQLANYEFYCSFDKNKEFIYNKYGISVDRPKLHLVVGSQENVDPAEVREALRAYDSDRFSVIDYDSLVRAYLISD